MIRYQRAGPGELLHIDTKKLGRIERIGHRIRACPRAGKPDSWGNRARHQPRRRLGDPACRHRRCRQARLQRGAADERKASAIAFRALDWFAHHGVTVERVMTDNGSAYRSHDFRHACADAGLRHLRTRPYTPRANGKAERFIQTALRGWAYARPYTSSSERSHAIDPWLHHYNHHPPTPASTPSPQPLA